MMRNVATSTGNRDIGIYDDQGNLLVNMGSTAAGSVNSIQSFDIADTTLLPGTYYAALVCASASNVQDGWTMGTNGAGLAAAWGVFEIAATALPLPNPATFVSATGLFVPFIGMTSRVLV